MLEDKQKVYFFLQYVKKLSTLTRFLLRSINQESGNCFDLNLMSAHVDSGLWYTAKYTTSSFLVLERKCEFISKAAVKFMLYE